MGPPPIHSPQTTAGRYRMTRPSRRSSSQGAACGVWIRAWGQREPAVRGTGRLNRSAPWLGWLKGGLDIPAMYADRRSLPWEHPLRTSMRSAWSRAGQIEKRLIEFTSLAPSRRRAARGSSANRTRPCPQRRSRQGWSAFSQSPNSVINTKGRAFRRQTTMLNDLWPALVDEPMAHLHGCATRFLTLRGSA